MMTLRPSLLLLLILAGMGCSDSNVPADGGMRVAGDGDGDTGDGDTRDGDPDYSCSSYEDAPAPDGEFLKVVAVGRSACALRIDGELVCFGDEDHVHKPPAGPFVDMALGNDHGCALRQDGRAECWASDLLVLNWPEEAELLTTPPQDRRFVALYARDMATCGLGEDGVASCWGRLEKLVAAPDDAFESLSVAPWSACGLTAEGDAVCWGTDEYYEASPPDQRFTEVGVGRELGCGLGPDGRAVCWGGGTSRNSGDGICLNTSGLDLEPPDVPLRHLALGDACIACGLDSEGHVHCWGAPSLADLNDTKELPTAAFEQISVAYNFLCGVKPDSTLLCWGARDCPED